MGIRVPESWMELRHPDMRAALLDTLVGLGDPAYQQAAWIERSIDQHLITGIDQVYHFLYDDTDLGNDPDGCIGYTLFDFEEAKAVRAITELLDLLLDELGDARDANFLRHPLWPRVVERANLAFALLERRGIPTYT
jgi:hypothetical protein